MKILRIAFCILACCCVLAAVPIGIFAGLEWLISDLILCGLFGAGMIFAKNKTEPRGNTPDFMDPPSQSEEEKKDDGNGTD